MIWASVKRVFFNGISSFILPRKFYFRIPLRSGGITEEVKQTTRRSSAEVHDTLQARSPLQRRRASEIATLEMELEQHRRLRDTRLIAAVRDLAVAYFTTGRFVTRTDAEQRHLKLARELVGDDPACQMKAAKKLEGAGTSLDELYARAYQSLAEGLRRHKKLIEGLESAAANFWMTSMHCVSSRPGCGKMDKRGRPKAARVDPLQNARRHGLTAPVPSAHTLTIYREILTNPKQCPARYVAHKVTRLASDFAETEAHVERTRAAECEHLFGGVRADA
ncbi:hypothetical protein HGG71_07985, partial [Rhodobacteraceae bacterium R_SAG2]|nr:hypothetical protein [Rhodobacteraceae bacterium R_SAG2]